MFATSSSYTFLLLKINRTVNDHSLNIFFIANATNRNVTVLSKINANISCQFNNENFVLSNIYINSPIQLNHFVCEDQI